MNGPIGIQFNFVSYFDRNFNTFEIDFISLLFNWTKKNKSKNCL